MLLGDIFSHPIIFENQQDFQCPWLSPGSGHSFTQPAVAVPADLNLAPVPEDRHPAVLAVGVDARDPLDVAEAGAAVEWADYVNSWKPAAAPGRSTG